MCMCYSFRYIPYRCKDYKCYEAESDKDGYCLVFGRERKADDFPCTERTVLRVKKE